MVPCLDVEEVTGLIFATIDYLCDYEQFPLSLELLLFHLKAMLPTFTGRKDWRNYKRNS
jgi:hypothetical protein